MREVSLPEDAEALASWLKSERATAMGPPREDQRWKEWWCLLKFYRRRHATWFLPRDCTVAWPDAHGLPDFEVRSNSGRFFIEVTEATTQKERKAIALRRQHPHGTVHRLSQPVEGVGKGERGKAPQGRFLNGARREEWEEALVSDVREAISRKAGKTKTYAADAAEIGLLVYPNSDATFADPTRVQEMLQNDAPSTPFRWTVVLWPDDRFIELGRGGAVLH